MDSEPSLDPNRPPDTYHWPRKECSAAEPTYRGTYVQLPMQARRSIMMKGMLLFLCRLAIQGLMNQRPPSPKKCLWLIFL
jgi:hypothetical protein